MAKICCPKCNGPILMTRRVIGSLGVQLADDGSPLEDADVTKLDSADWFDDILSCLNECGWEEVEGVDEVAEWLEKRKKT